MVWSACVIVSGATTGKDYKEGDGKHTVLKRVKLPCPYRVQMLKSSRIPGTGGSVSLSRSQRTTMLSAETTNLSTLPPIIHTSSAAQARTTASTTSGDLAFIRQTQEYHQTRLLFAIKQLSKRHRERLAVEQFALRQQAIRDTQRKAGQKSIGYRVEKYEGNFNSDDYLLDELSFLQPLIKYLNLGALSEFDSRSKMVADQVGDSDKEIQAKVLQADQKARQRLFWSDRMNKWITVSERGGPNQQHVFWSFVHSKKLYRWDRNNIRFHNCKCKGHRTYRGVDDNMEPCPRCLERWEAYRMFIEKMKARLRLLQEGKLSEEEIKKYRLKEAKRLRKYLQMAVNMNDFRPRKQEKKFDMMNLSADAPRNTEETLQFDDGDDDDDLEFWNDSEDGELLDIDRGRSDISDDDFDNREDDEFVNKMYERLEADQDDPFPSPTPPPIPLIPPSTSPKTPSPSPPPQPVLLPPQLPILQKTSIPKRHIPHLPKKKKGKKGKQTPEKVLPPLTLTPSTPKVEPVPTPVTAEPLADESQDSISSPLPPLPTSFGSSHLVMLEESDADMSTRMRRRRSSRVTFEGDNFDCDFDFEDDDFDEQPPVPESPPKIKLSRPANWGQESSLADELSFRASKSANKRRALDKAIAQKQKAAMGRKPKIKAKVEANEEELEEEEEEIALDMNWLDQFYFIQDKTLSGRCKFAFNSADLEQKGWLTMDQTLSQLCRVNPDLSEQETFYIQRVLELFGVDTDKGISFQIFTVLSVFSLRITALDEWIRAMLNEIDFRLLEYKLDFSKKLWLTCSDDSKHMSENQFRILLLAGGVTIEHERSACAKLFAERSEPHILDFLDFLSYLPLFIAIHLHIASNPMSLERTV